MTPILHTDLQAALLPLLSLAGQAPEPPSLRAVVAQEAEEGSHPTSGRA